MRMGILVFLAAMAAMAAFAPSAAWSQQRTLTLEAAPVPMVAAEINGRPVRLEVDLRLPRGLALSNESADRLRVFRVPFAAAHLSVEGGSSMRTRLARPEIKFGGDNVRAFSVIAPSAVSPRADGVIGPGVLPYNVVTITLNANVHAVREVTFPLQNADAWYIRANLGGSDLDVSFDLSNDASIFNRSAARLFDGAGLITASGALSEQALILGLSTMMQPVSTDLQFSLLPLAPAYARTNSPLLGATEPDAIVVTAEGEGPEPSLIVGRAALASCASISVDRRARRLTLRCA